MIDTDRADVELSDGRKAQAVTGEEPADESPAVLRKEARAFMLDTREHVRSLDPADREGAGALIERLAESAASVAARWTSDVTRRRFLIELASAARSERMAQFAPQSTAARLYDRLAKRIDELLDADRS